MLQNCNKVHFPSFSEVCCLNQLIAMSEFAKTHFLQGKYTRYFFKEIVSNHKENNLNYSLYNLETIKNLLRILIEQMCHFYFMNNSRFSKALVNISLDIHQKSLFKSHPEVVYLISAVYNNVACIYERTKIYNKAKMYFNHYNKAVNNNIDRLIYYNNFIRVLIKENAVSASTDLIKLFGETLLNEVDNAKNEKLIRMNSDDIKASLHCTDFSQKCKLLSFLMFNYGCLFEIMDKKKEANEVFKKGYEFSLCMLAENDLLIAKFIPKLDKKREVYSKSKTLSGYRSKTPIERRRNKIDTDTLNQKMEKILVTLGEFQNKIKTKKDFNISMDNSISGMSKEEKESDKVNNSGIKKEEVKNNSNRNSNLNQSSGAKSPAFGFGPKNTSVENMLNDIVKEYEEEVKVKNQAKMESQEKKAQSQEPPKEKPQKEEPQKQEEPEFKKPPRIKKLFERVLGVSKKSKNEPKGMFSSLISSLISGDKKEQKEIPKKEETVDFQVASSRKSGNVIDLFDDNVNELNESEGQNLEYPKGLKKKTKIINPDIAPGDLFAPILSNPPKTTNKLEYKRTFNNTDYTISVEIQPSSLNFTLLASPNQEISTLNLEYKKIKSTLQKMMLSFGISPLNLMKSINTVEKFCNFFVQFISIMKSSSHKLKFGISPIPIGMIMDKRIEFKINKVAYIIDILKIGKAYKAMITSIHGKPEFCVNVYFRNDGEELSKSQLEQFLLKLVAKIQEITKTKKNFDLGGENIVNNCYVEDDELNFYTCKYDCDFEVVLYSKENQPITGEVTDEILEENFMMKTEDIDSMTKDERSILMNILCNSYDLVEGKLRFKKKIIFSHAMTNNTYTVEFVLVEEKTINYLLLKVCNVKEKTETCRIFLNDGGDMMSHHFIENFINNSNDQKIFKMAEEIYNEKKLVLFDIIDSLIS